jgi:hypothetical protein
MDRDVPGVRRNVSLGAKMTDTVWDVGILQVQDVQHH